jgi:hypothetical protein
VAARIVWRRFISKWTFEDPREVDERALGTGFAPSSR